MIKLRLRAFVMTAAVVVAFPAASQTLVFEQGGSADPLRVAYLSAAEPSREIRSVEARDVSIDQVRWDRAVFHPDNNRRLVHVQLWTRAQSYAQLRARLANPNDALWDLLDSAGVKNASSGSNDIMICNHGASGVVLSFDRRMAAPVEVQLAELEAQDHARVVAE
jgi:hypothetical protein